MRVRKYEIGDHIWCFSENEGIPEKIFLDLTMSLLAKERGKRGWGGGCSLIIGYD